jgi:hypothetical protein
MNISILETDLTVYEPISLIDANFIYDLRTNKKNNYLKPISENLEEQKKFINNYLKEFDNGNQIYYKIFEKKNLNKVGLVRITNLKNEKKRIGWESLIISDKAQATTGLDVILTVYTLAFKILKNDHLGPWLVRKQNNAMMKIHKFMDIVTILEETNENYKLEVDKDNFFAKYEYFKKLGFGKLKIRG